MLVGLGTIAGLALFDLREDGMREAKVSTANLAQAIQQDIARTIATYDLSLLALVKSLELPGIDAVSPDMRDAALFDGSAGAPYLGAMLATDEDGTVRYASRASVTIGENISERPFFQLHREHRNLGLYISRPFVARSSGSWVVSLSRRRADRNGAFAGVVSGTLRLDYFDDLSHRFDLGAGATLALLTTDGTYLARLPARPDMIGHRPDGASPWESLTPGVAGSFVARSRTDGNERLYSYARVEHSPFIVVVGLTTDAIYANWGRRTRVIAPILVLLTVLAGAWLLLAETLRRELARRRAAERDSRRGTAIYRILAEHSGDVVTCLSPHWVSLYVSPSITDQLGFPPEHFVGQAFLDRVHPEDRPAVLAALTTLRDGEGRVTVTYRTTHRDGREIWSETAFRQLRNPDTDAQEEVIGTTRDVTRRKLAEDELNSNARELTHLAMTDSLTGLGNRRHFDHVLDAESLRARREGSTVSLLMIDADYFKSYNDTYGHPAGDAVLRSIARVLREHARRPADFAARYGGEEFAIILPATEVEGAVIVAEQIRRALAAMAIPHMGSPSRTVTISIGVASVVGDGQGTSQTLVEAADAALYDAKRMGRDRIEIYGAGTTPLRSLEGKLG